MSNYERANRRLKEMQERIKEKRRKQFSLANELGNKLKVQEWKMNPTFNKFKRQVKFSSECK